MVDLLIFLLEHGVATEFVQRFVPERSGEVSDILIDHGGVALGVAVDVAVVAAAGLMVTGGRTPASTTPTSSAGRLFLRLEPILGGQTRQPQPQQPRPPRTGQRCVHFSKPTGRSSARSSSLT